MEIIELKQEDMMVHGKTTGCAVFSVLIKIKSIDSRVSEMIQLIGDTSWIKKLGPVEQRTFLARSERTIKRLIEEIFNKIESSVTTELGEYLISTSAQDILSGRFSHTQIPLAELWKEKVVGNPGFDFHSESDCHLIVFGEAKYSGERHPYRDAMEQISEFIALKKDDAELSDLKNFVSEKAINSYLNGRKAYVAAFSINSSDPRTIINNALSSKYIDKLLNYPKLFILGVIIDA